MPTKASAIALLRATGTLVGEQRQAITVTHEQARAPITGEINRLMMGNARAAGLRHVAPSSNQAVLP